MFPSIKRYQMMLLITMFYSSAIAEEFDEGIHTTDQDNHVITGSGGDNLKIEMEGNDFDPAYGLKATGGSSIIVNNGKHLGFTTEIDTVGQLADGIIAGRLGALDSMGNIVDYIDEEGSRYSDSKITVYGETHIMSLAEFDGDVGYGLRVVGDGAQIDLLSIGGQGRSTVHASGAAIRYDYGNGYNIDSSGISSKLGEQIITLENVDLTHDGMEGDKFLNNDGNICLTVPFMCDGAGYNTLTNGHLIEVGNHDIEAGLLLNDGESTMTVANAVKNGVLNLSNSTATAVDGKDLLHVTYGGGTDNISDKVSSTFTLNAYNGTRLNGSIFTDLTIDHEGNKSETTINLNQSDWFIPRDSNVTTLKLNGSKVYIGSDQTVPINDTNKVLLAVDYLSGSGEFYLRTDIIKSGLQSKNISDQLHVLVKGTGNHSFFITDHNTGGLSALGNEQVVLAKIASGDALFNLGNVNGYVDLGAYRYYLHSNENVTGEKKWYLDSASHSKPEPKPEEPEQKPDPKPTPKPEPNIKTLTNTANNSVNVLNINYLLNQVEIDLVHDRMNILRNHEGGFGLWMKGYGGKFGSIKTDLQKFGLKYYGMDIGYDHLFSGSQGDLYVGAMAGYLNGVTHYKEQREKGHSHNYHVGLYASFESKKGLYVEGFLKYSHLKNNFTAKTGFGYLVSGKGKTNAYSASVKLGQRFYIKENKGWYLEPQLQLSYTHLNSQTIKANNGLSTHLNSMDSVEGRTYLNAGYLINQGGGKSIDLHLGVGFRHEFKGKSGYRFNHDEALIFHSNKNNSWDTRFGINAKFNEQHNLSLDVHYISGQKFNRVGVKIGYRLDF